MNNSHIASESQEVKGTEVTKIGYLNTTSSAGYPAPFAFTLEEVVAVKIWHNGCGNPSTVIHLNDGTMLYMVDDYSAMSNMGGAMVGRKTVNRRKDLFVRW